MSVRWMNGRVVSFVDGLKIDVVELRWALDRSVTLQSHYAALLNQYDGGSRHVYVDSLEWLERLQDLTKSAVKV